MNPKAMTDSATTRWSIFRPLAEQSLNFLLKTRTVSATVVAPRAAP